ncbi:Poly(ADP-ribose) polymerase, catalytic domain protein [Niveomyces insectorum RCEF 264]|uniref:Poly [ADP-ribose] polymerase n=1 Tax=Niveomyces insectorum RCEF 264 TaxID=1081102 RepID=A0A167NFI7_9HYPO|nr:Poly(ADP-ribose) polymerase, catalytic domain protein [Niveomyces insectorum RCEF 264]
MAPSRYPAAKVKGASSSPPLGGCKIALCGSFGHFLHVTLIEHIEKLGGAALTAVTDEATHLITTPNNYYKPTAKVKRAQGFNIPIVDVRWLLDCLATGLKHAETTYLFSKAPLPASPIAPGVSKPSSETRKRVASATPQPSQPLPKKMKDESAAGKIASATLKIPVDECCPFSNAIVYIDTDEVVWDASLNQTNSGNNNNKFYRIQILDLGNNQFRTWTRWGRVGEKGQSSVLGNGTLEDALKKFNQKFRDKSGVLWGNRSSDPVPGKYAFIEKNYQPDLDGDGESQAGGAAATGNGRSEASIQESPVCSLEAPVQDLMELIFNRQFFTAVMTDLNYDANKLPLGKLSKSTISRGFQALKDLSALLDDAGLAQSIYGLTFPAAIENLSNLYHTVIPHAFGRHRPPLIDDYVRLKKEIELLESLSDMKDAELLMKVDRAGSDRIHPADKLYRGLGMKELAVLDPSGKEFQELANYLYATRGTTHDVKYDVENIFRIEREGEQDRFENYPLSGSNTDTRLLWHGSRVTNFGGILNQGLRIAPPEAPVSGYMFGKGIYLADMSSKSANYCCSSISGGTALLLLCEAKLGSPLQMLTAASYTAGEQAKEKGMHSTLGLGRTGPLAWKDAGVIHQDLVGVKMQYC